MLILNKFDYQSLSRIETDGTRKYQTPDGEKVPSVTTVLSLTKDNTFLNEWKKNVGEFAAERIKTEASTLGTGMHENIERYIKGEKLQGSFMAKTLANVIIKNGLNNVEEVWGTEVSLYTKGLYAGTTDLVAQLKNKKSAIIDFKNSLREKEKDWIEDYFLQGCAYKLSHDELYNTNIDQIVIMIATRDAVYQEFIIEGKEIEIYTHKWLERLEKYYKLCENKNIIQE